MRARACANATVYGKEDITMGNAEAKREQTISNTLKDLEKAMRDIKEQYNLDLEKVITEVTTQERNSCKIKKKKTKNEN